MSTEIAHAAVDAIVDHYRNAFTRHCTCGDPDCAKPTPAPAHDYRVLACSTFNALEVVGMLLADGDVATARELVEAMQQYARGPLVERLDEDLTWREHVVAFLGIDDVEARIRDELAETVPDVAAELAAEEAAEQRVELG